MVSKLRSFIDDDEPREDLVDTSDWWPPEVDVEQYVRVDKRGLEKEFARIYSAGVNHLMDDLCLIFCDGYLFIESRKCDEYVRIPLEDIPTMELDRDYGDDNIPTPVNVRDYF